MFGGISTPQVGKEVPEPPSDTPTETSWFWAGPHAHALLCVSSWDGSVRLWEVQTQAPLVNQPSTIGSDPVPNITNIAARAIFRHPAPTLTAKIVQGQTIFSGTADKKVMMHNLHTNQSQQIGVHDAPVRRVFFNEKRSLLCSVGWEANIKWWDTRSPQPAAVQQAPAVLQDADMTPDVLAVLAEDRKVYAYDLSTMSVQPQGYTVDPLHYPPNTLKLFRDNQGVVIGGTEGRCRIFHLNPANTKDDFNFRAHRTNDVGDPVIGSSSPMNSTKIFPIHALDFNPIYQTLLTAGGDGIFYMWDKDSRQKLHASTSMKIPISCASFDPSGRMLACGLGYDWAMGAAGRRQDGSQPNKVVVIPMLDSWIKNKKK